MEIVFVGPTEIEILVYEGRGTILAFRMNANETDVTKLRCVSQREEGSSHTDEGIKRIPYDTFLKVRKFAIQEVCKYRQDSDSTRMVGEVNHIETDLKSRTVTVQVCVGDSVTTLVFKAGRDNQMFVCGRTGKHVNSNFFESARGMAENKLGEAIADMAHADLFNRVLEKTP